MKKAQLLRGSSAEAKRLFDENYRKLCTRTDYLFALVLGVQWPGAILAVLFISPKMWEGGMSHLHPHVFTTIYVGALITIPPVLFAYLRPGERYTRHLIAACQMLMSGLLIHVTGGRIETHFHVFGSLAFLAFYLDWEVLVTASIFITIHHIVMAYSMPAAIFGTASASDWRLVEHCFWVLFCDTFLITSCVQSLKALKDAAQREADQDTLLYQAYHDNLTGLGNRLLVQKDMAARLEEPAGTRRPFALVAIDLDRFKEVNDTLGHQVGDQVLKEASERLLAEARKGDTLVRMGGDEFALVLDDCSDPALAERIATRIIHGLNQPFQCGPHTISIGVSIGICLHSGDGVDLPGLFQHADLALYKAKNTGRNSHVIFDEQMRAHTLEQMSLEHRLRTAILEKALELYYQPIVDAQGGVLGFEALLRWNDPTHGNVPPSVFIPVAERTGLIVPLGNWVVERACAQAAEWYTANNHPLKMSINISSHQLAHASFVPTVLQALRDSALPAEMLDLELTESALIQNHGEAQEKLQLLRKFGVRLSIDDFGTGYSSLSYLRDLPVHTLKIDRSFVTDIVASAEARVLISSMIEMAHSLKLRVVAEGVENRNQMDVLIGVGCDEIQGFHISRAIPAAEAHRLFGEPAAPTPLAPPVALDFAADLGLISNFAI